MSKTGSKCLKLSSKLPEKWQNRSRTITFQRSVSNTAFLQPLKQEFKNLQGIFTQIGFILVNLVIFRCKLSQIGPRFAEPKLCSSYAANRKEKINNEWCTWNRNPRQQTDSCFWRDGAAHCVNTNPAIGAKAPTADSLIATLLNI